MLFGPVVSWKLFQKIAALSRYFEWRRLTLQVRPMIRIQSSEQFNPLIRKLDFLTVLKIALLSHIAGHNGMNEGHLLILSLEFLYFCSLRFADYRKPIVSNDSNFGLDSRNTDNAKLFVDSLNALIFQG